MATIVRWVSFILVMLLVGATVGLYVVKVWMEDRRPMTVRVQSALDEDLVLRLTGAWDQAPEGKSLPKIRFEGAGADGQITLPAGGMVEVPVHLDVPGGLWSVISGRSATGDVRGKVGIEPVLPVEEFPGREFELSVHVASLWEIWRPLVLWLILTIALFGGLWWLSRQVLVTPFGELAVVPRSAGVGASAVAGSGERSYDLSDPRRRLFWPFWMRDLICVDTCPLRNLRMVHRVKRRDAPFVLQFTVIGPTIFCPRGEIDVLEPGDSSKTRRVADRRIVARWRREQQQAPQQKSRPPSGQPAAAPASSSSQGGSLVFSSLQPSQAPPPGEDVPRYECLLLDDGAAIVDGDYLIVYSARKTSSLYQATSDL